MTNKWKWLVGLSLAIAAGASLIASGQSVTFRPTSDPFSVGCYDTLNQQADTMVLGFKEKSGMAAAGICAQEWAAQGHPVGENLVTCVVNGGGLGVFPNSSGLSAEDACASIGAAVPENGRPYGGFSAEEIRAFDRELATRYEATWNAGSTCRSVDVLHRVANEVIARSASPSWSVLDLTSSGGRRCATFTIDALGAKVILVDADL